MVQGTMNGYGERCGNANLVSIVAEPPAQARHRRACPSLAGLTEASHLLDELLNLTPDANRPYVGKNAFAHKGGMHVAGVNADPATFEHIDPAAVGNTREVLISELSGKGTVLGAPSRPAPSSTTRRAARVAERVKALEHRGFAFEAADGSFDLLIRRETGEYEPLFRLESWRVIAEKREDGWCRPRRRSRSGSTASASCAPPRATARCTRSTARCATRSASATAPARHPARQLQGPHPRGVEGDRRHDPRAARRLRRRRHVGGDRRARERHRGVVGRARGLAWRRGCCRAGASRAARPAAWA